MTDGSNRVSHRCSPLAHRYQNEVKTKEHMRLKNNSLVTFFQGGSSVVRNSYFSRLLLVSGLTCLSYCDNFPSVCYMRTKQVSVAVKDLPSRYRARFSSAFLAILNDGFSQPLQAKAGVVYSNRPIYSL
jgi:hypothetical protein